MRRFQLGTLFTAHLCRMEENSQPCIGISPEHPPNQFKFALSFEAAAHALRKRRGSVFRSKPNLHNYYESLGSDEEKQVVTRYVQSRDGSIFSILTTEIYEKESADEEEDPLFLLEYKPEKEEEMHIREYKPEKNQEMQQGSRKLKQQEIICKNCCEMFKGILCPRYGPYCSEDCRQLWEIRRVKLEGMSVEHGTFVSSYRRTQYMTALFLDNVLSSVVEQKRRRNVSRFEFTGTSNITGRRRSAAHASFSKEQTIRQKKPKRRSRSNHSFFEKSSEIKLSN